MEITFKENPNKDHYLLEVFINNNLAGEITRPGGHFWLKLNGLETISPNGDILSNMLGTSKEVAVRRIESMYKFIKKYT